MSSLISRVQSELLDPLTIYRFLDAATKSLAIDSQLGGITGLYDLGESLRGIPSSKIAFFTLPNFPRGEVVAGDTANVLWTQPEDSKIFASFRNDVPASSTLFSALKSATAQATVAAGLSDRSQQLVTATPTPTATPAATTSASAAAPAPASASTSTTASPSATATSSPVTIQARTANQSICAG